MLVSVFQGEASLGAAAERAAGADLLVLPELFLTGYNIGAEALRAHAQAVDGPHAQEASDIARRHRMALLYGYPERTPDGALYNSALLVGADGATLANYRKTHLFGDMEREVFTPGDAPFVLATVAGVRTGILICYDVEFPENVRGLALRGAELIAVPTALMQPYEFVSDIMVRTRAFENQVFLAYANRCGEEPPLRYVGHSCIVAPDGNDLARAGADTEMISAPLDFVQAARSRALNTYLRDRLPQHYAEPHA